MAKPFHTRDHSAKPPREERFVSARRMNRLAVAIRGAAEEIWPTDRAKNLSRIAGVTPRCAQQWLGGETEPSADNLLALVLGEHGHTFLDHLARAWNSTPAWLMRWRAEQRAADLEAEIAERQAVLARMRSGRS